MKLEGRVLQCFADSIEVKQRAGPALAGPISSAAELISNVFLNNRKLLVCGNGGSAADAQHLAAEFVNRFELERPGLPAVALTTDSSVLTSVGNDSRFAEVFSRQVQALGQPGDCLIVISTSGDSENILGAIAAAHERELPVILLTGQEGGRASTTLDGEDIELRVPARSTARIQEVHILVLHCLCDLVDHQLFGTET